MIDGSEGNKASAISMKTGSACALMVGGTVRCWGDNGSGQLGNSTTTASSVPVEVHDIDTNMPAQAIALGAAHACVILQGGGVKCWGAAANGRLGNGTTTPNVTKPTSYVVGIDGSTSDASAVAIASGYTHSCAVLANGRVKCWGTGVRGQLGDGQLDASSPVLVSGISGVGLDQAVSIAGGSDFTCALLRTGAVKCWGDQQSGQLGDGVVDTNPQSAVQIVQGIGGSSLESKAVAISAGQHSACALMRGGQVHCWGSTANGVLGQTSGNTSEAIPIQIADLDDAGGFFDEAAVAGTYELLRQ